MINRLGVQLLLLLTIVNVSANNDDEPRCEKQDIMCFNPESWVLSETFHQKDIGKVRLEIKAYTSAKMLIEIKINYVDTSVRLDDNEGVTLSQGPAKFTCTRAGVTSSDSRFEARIFKFNGKEHNNFESDWFFCVFILELKQEAAQPTDQQSTEPEKKNETIVEYFSMAPFNMSSTTLKFKVDDARNPTEYRYKTKASNWTRASICSVWQEVVVGCNMDDMTTHDIINDEYKLTAVHPLDSCGSYDVLVKDGDKTFKSPKIFCDMSQKQFKYQGGMSAKLEAYCIEKEYCTMCNSGTFTLVPDCTDCIAAEFDFDSVGCAIAKCPDNRWTLDGKNILSDATVACKKPENGRLGWHIVQSASSPRRIIPSAEPISCLSQTTCDPKSVLMKECTAEGHRCPEVTAESVTCPAGSVLMNATGSPVTDVTCDIYSGYYKNLDGEVHCEIPCEPSSVKVKTCESTHKCVIANAEDVTCPEGSTLMNENSTAIHGTTCDVMTGIYNNIVGEVHCELPCNSSAVIKMDCAIDEQCVEVTDELVSCPAGSNLTTVSGTNLNNATCDHLSGLYTNVDGEMHCEIPCDPSSTEHIACSLFSDQKIYPCPSFTPEGISCPTGSVIMNATRDIVSGKTCNKMKGLYVNPTDKLRCEILCVPESVKVRECTAEEKCPNVTMNGVTCPEGSKLKDDNGFLIIGATCDTVIGNYTNINETTVVHCEIECDPGTVTKRKCDKWCPTIEKETITCPEGTALALADERQIHNTTCNTKIGVYPHVEGEIHCAMLCKPSSVKVKECSIDGKCPIVALEGVSCPTGGVLLGASGNPLSETTCDPLTGEYKNLDGEVYCRFACVPSSVYLYMEAPEKWRPTVTVDEITCPSGSTLISSVSRTPLTDVKCDTTTGGYKGVDGEIRCSMTCVPSSVKVKECVQNKCPIITEEEITCPEGGKLTKDGFYIYGTKCDPNFGDYTNVKDNEIQCQYECGRSSVSSIKPCESNCPLFKHDELECEEGTFLWSTSGRLDSNMARCDNTIGAYVNVSGEVGCVISCDPKSVTFERCKYEDSCRPIVTEEGISCPAGGNLTIIYPDSRVVGSITCDMQTGRYNGCDNCNDIFCDGLLTAKEKENIRQAAETKAAKEKQDRDFDEAEAEYNRQIILGVSIGGGLLVLIAIGIGVFCCFTGVGAIIFKKIKNKRAYNYRQRPQAPTFTPVAPYSSAPVHTTTPAYASTTGYSSAAPSYGNAYASPYEPGVQLEGVPYRNIPSNEPPLW